MNRPIVEERLSYCDEEYIDKCQEDYENYIDLLEKALDMACERLRVFFIEKNKCEQCGESWNTKKCKACWKEYLLKESEKQ